MAIEAPGPRDEVRRVVAGLNRVIDDIRDYIRGLGEPPMDAGEIAAALRTQAANFMADTGHPVDFWAEGIEVSGPLPSEAGQHLHHIMREALSNTARHAGRCRSRVALRFGADEMELDITDDGSGISEEAARDSVRGMRNMRQRGRRLGGRIVVSRRPEGGTRVLLSVPLDAEGPDDGESLPSPQEVAGPL